MTCEITDEEYDLLARERVKRLKSRASDAKPLMGVMACTNCTNIEETEREVICHNCGKGEMVYVRAHRICSYAKCDAGLKALYAEQDPEGTA